MRIGVLDSGVGGLIVANELRRAFSNIGVVFIADSANFPYGNKSDEQLVDIVHDRIMLLERMDVDIIVLACNTASSIAERYRIKCDTPLVSIIDATVQQATASVDSECFVVLATESTVASGIYTKKLQSAFQRPICVREVACQRLVSWVEARALSTRVSDEDVRQLIDDLSIGQSSSIVLGCTHFILLEEALRSLFPGSTIVAPIEPLKDYIAQFIGDRNRISGTAPMEVYTTANPTLFADKARKLVGLLEVVPLVPDFGGATTR